MEYKKYPIQHADTLHLYVTAARHDVHNFAQRQAERKARMQGRPSPIRAMSRNWEAVA